MVQFKELTPMLWVPDLAAAKNYYVDILGFSCHEFSEEWKWASLRQGNVGLMLAEPNEHIPYPGPTFTGSLYIRVDNADALWEQLKYKTEVVYPPDNFDYGMREFAIKDNNGFLLQFGHSLDT